MKVLWPSSSGSKETKKLCKFPDESSFGLILGQEEFFLSKRLTELKSAALKANIQRR